MLVLLGLVSASYNFFPIPLISLIGVFALNKCTCLGYENAELLWLGINPLDRMEFLLVDGLKQDGVWYKLVDYFNNEDNLPYNKFRDYFERLDNISFEEFNDEIRAHYGD